jgi:hypothetical protein
MMTGIPWSLDNAKPFQLPERTRNFHALLSMHLLFGYIRYSQRVVIT